MNKKLFLFFATVFAFVAYAQVPQTPLVEHFTQASCGPCASQNPTLKNRLDAFGTANYVRVSHQTSWPGVDPMNAAFPEGPDVRRNYYGVTGVPNTSLNGAAVGGSGTVITANTLSNAAAQTTPYEIVASQTWVTAGELTVNIQINNTTSSPVSTANTLIVSMVENEVSYASAPGSNGETQFEYVLRQMYDASSGLPNATTGTPIGMIPANGNVSFSFTLTEIPSHVADKSELSFAMYLQNEATRQIYQAAKTTASTPNGAFSVSAVSQSTAGTGVCDLSFSPEIVLTNEDFSSTITSAVVEYSINGGAPVQETYTGSLGWNQSATITFPAGSLNAGLNTVSQRVVSINGAQNWLRPIDVAIEDASYAKLNAVANSGSLVAGFESTPAVAVTTSTPDGILSSTTVSENQFTILNGPLLGRAPLGGFANSDSSIIFDFWTIQSGSADFIMQKVDLGSNSTLTFSHSYRQYNTTTDALEIFISTDCGSTWTSLWYEEGAALSTGSPENAARFFPTSAADWTSTMIDLSAYDNTSEAIIRFTGISNYGNNLYIDDLDLNSTLSNDEVVQSQVTLYPNPSSESIHIAGLSSEKKYQIFNVQGALLLEGSVSNNQEINITNLTQGVFFIKLEDQGSLKFVKK